MKEKFSVLLVTAVVLLAFTVQSLPAQDAASGTAQDAQWKKFSGAWFDVLHPSDFSPEPSLKSRTNTNGCDSAFFHSPAKEVSFYVFSPQWNGKPTDILLNPDKEKQVSHEQTEKDGEITRNCTIAAKDGSYTRSYVDVENSKTNTRRVFGISYKDQKVFDQYKDKYLQFQNSLVQFAD